MLAVLSVILGILKIIGLILLIILGLILFLVCLILFVPVRYSAEGRKDGENMEGSARVTWLLHFISFRISFSKEEGQEKKLNKEICIFGISIERIKAFFENKKKKKQEKAKQRHRAEKKKKIQKIKKENPEKYEELKAEALKKKQAEAVRQEEALREADKRAAVSSETSDGTKKESGAGERNDFSKFRRFCLKIWKGIINFIKKFFHSALHAVLFFWNLPSRILSAIAKILFKIHSVCGKIIIWKNFITDTRTRVALRLIKKQLGRLLKHIKPVKFGGSIVFGFDDPSKTGEVLAAVSMFYPFYSRTLSIVPDFNSKQLQGNLYFKGRIFIFYLIFIGLTTWFNKNIKYAVGFFKSVKEDKE